MNKVLLSVSIAVTLGAMLLGLFNKGKLSRVRAELASSQQQAQQENLSLEQAQKNLKEKTSTLTTVMAEKDLATAQLATSKNDAEKVKAQVIELTAQMGTKDSEIAKLTADIQAKEEQLQTLNSSQTATPGQETPEIQSELQEKETLITKLQGDLDASRDQLSELRKKSDDRKALQMRQGLEGQITAVNQAWNFVVLNLGDRNGVLGNTEMLVKRGNQLVGKLRITSVEPASSIADIVASSVPRGMNIQPGDHVIYQATTE